MKSLFKTLSLLAVATCIAISGTAAAESKTARRNISLLMVMDDGSVRVTAPSRWGDTESCNRGADIVLHRANVAFPENYSLLLAAQLNGWQIQAIVDGCQPIPIGTICA